MTYHQDRRIVPNPTQGSFTVRGLSEAAAYHLFTAAGREVRAGRLAPGETISLSWLPDGYYVLRLNGPAGEVEHYYILKAE